MLLDFASRTFIFELYVLPKVGKEKGSSTIGARKCRSELLEKTKWFFDLFKAFDYIKGTFKTPQRQRQPRVSIMHGLVRETL